MPSGQRYALCDGCGKGFVMPVAEFQAVVDHICKDCEHKRLKLYLLREELRSASRYGHTSPGPCELCAIQNQIDDILTGGYDWRDEYERLTANSAVSGNH